MFIDFLNIFLHVFLGSENPQFVEEEPIHTERLTIWCVFWQGGIRGLFFFEKPLLSMTSVTVPCSASFVPTSGDDDMCVRICRFYKKKIVYGFFKNIIISIAEVKRMSCAKFWKTNLFSCKTY